MTPEDDIRAFRASIIARDRSIDERQRAQATEDYRNLPAIERRTIHLPSTPFQRIMEEQERKADQAQTGNIVTMFGFLNQPGSDPAGPVFLNIQVLTNSPDFDDDLDDLLVVQTAGSAVLPSPQNSCQAVSQVDVPRSLCVYAPELLPDEPNIEINYTPQLILPPYVGADGVGFGVHVAFTATAKYGGVTLTVYVEESL